MDFAQWINGLTYLDRFVHIARKRSLKWINTAFFKLNAVISSVFFAVVAAEVLFPFFRRIP